jgi:hypothetical protein
MKNLQEKEAAVMLSETTGILDTGSTVKDKTMMFSLSVLLSSVQILNAKDKFSGDYFSNLALFTEFSGLIASRNPDFEESEKPFQDLIRLIRDWAYADDCPHDWSGGIRILKE